MWQSDQIVKVPKKPAVLLIIHARDKPIFKKIQIIDDQQVEVHSGDDVIVSNHS